MPDRQDREIRVFISSTFRDMQAERDVLVKKIFPQLRKLCEERAVAWTEVDLRWGITEEQKAEGQVLPFCLNEIRSCRPYFIGLLGERYGWVPDDISATLLDAYPWLQQHLDHSVTELEIVHGVFNEEAMHKHAYFYFRDPKFVDGVPLENQPLFMEEKKENEPKLEKLKDKIRVARDMKICQLREGYANPEQLGDWILQDFTRLINALYPQNKVPDQRDLEAVRHEAFAKSRRLAFVGREALIGRLNEQVASHGLPLLLTGESGCGKSSLLAEWAARWRQDHSSDLVIQHFAGSTQSSADWQGLVHRILGELQRAFAISDEIPVQPDKLRQALGDWMLKATGQRRVVIILDALNQLIDDGSARQLGWLPEFLPPNIHLIGSALPGDCLDTWRQRGWPELKVPAFAPADIAPAAAAYLKIFSKTPSKELLAQLESTAAACNALYLRSVLDELRQFGVYEQLQTKASEYLSAGDLPELFDRILTRWQDDFGNDSEHPDLVRKSLCLISCSRFGLSEGELLDLLGSNGEPLPRLPWTPFYLAAENALVRRTGLLDFGHDYLRAAVGKRWLTDCDAVRDFRRQLAEYFETVRDLSHGRLIAEPSERKLDELPTLLLDLGEWEKLKNILSDIPIFLRLRERERWKVELNRFWIPLRQRYKVGEVYRAALAACEDTTTEQAAFLEAERQQGRYVNETPTFVTELAGHSEILGELGTFLSELTDYRTAEMFYRRALDMDETKLGPNHPQIARRLSDLAVLLQVTDQLDESERLIEMAVAIDRDAAGPQRIGSGIHLYNLAQLLRNRNRLPAAEARLQQALKIFEAGPGDQEARIANTLGSLGLLYQSTNRLAESERFLRRALAIRERGFGKDHPDVGRDCGNLGNLLREMNRVREAEPLLRRALAIMDRAVGSHHPQLSVCLVNLAALLEDIGQPLEAESLLKRALQIDEKCFGSTHPEVATDLSNLADLLFAMQRMAEAEPLLRRALAIQEQSFGVDHPEVAIVLNNLSAVLREQNQLDEAESVLRRALAIDEQAFGPNHPNVAIRLSNLFGILVARKRLQTAEPLLRRALAINERSYGSNHPNVATSLCNLAGLLRDRGQLDEAEPLSRRAFMILLRASQEEGITHPRLQEIANHYCYVLQLKGVPLNEIGNRVRELGRQFGINFGG